MTRQAKTLESNMELADIPGTSLKMSRVAIGTWAIGGWMWGGTDEAESVSTIRAALEQASISLIRLRYTGSAALKKLSARRSSRAACAQESSLPPRPDLNGRVEESFAMPAAHVSCGRSRTPCAGFEPITSISIRFTGPTRWLRSKRPRMRCTRCCGRERSAPSE